MSADLLKLSRPQQAEQLRLFPFLFERAGELLTVSQAAGRLNKSEQFVRDAFDNRLLLGHRVTSRKAGDEKAIERLIAPDSIPLFWALSANYEPAEAIAMMLRVAKRWPRERQLELRNALSQLLGTAGR